MCRFLLNLRQMHRPGSLDADDSDFSALQFQVETRIVANMGQPFQDADDEVDDAGEYQASSVPAVDSVHYSDLVEEASRYSVLAAT